MNKQEVILKEAHTLFKAHLPSSRTWRFKIDETAPRWKKGQCLPFYQTITISSWHLEEDSLEDIRDTILHEIAHALTTSFDFASLDPDMDHGSNWRKVAKSLGVDVTSYEIPGV